jgi:hypothetical protein
VDARVRLHLLDCFWISALKEVDAELSGLAGRYWLRALPGWTSEWSATFLPHNRLRAMHTLEEYEAERLELLRERDRAVQEINAP